MKIKFESKYRQKAIKEQLQRMRRKAVEMAFYNTEAMNKAEKRHYTFTEMKLSSIDTAEERRRRDRVLQDTGLGNLREILIPDNSVPEESLEALITTSLRNKSKILVVGQTGSGKTTIIKTAGKDLGYAVEVLETQTMSLEDLIGYPTTEDKKLPEMLAKVSEYSEDEKKAFLATQQIIDYLPEKIEELAKTENYKAYLAEACKIYEGITGTTISFKAPEWVGRVTTNWNIHRKKTLVILDEMNLAKPDVFSACMTLVLEVKIAGKDLGEGAIIAATGNFAEENTQVIPFNDALATRFDTVIVAMGYDFVGSIKYLRDRVFKDEKGEFWTTLFKEFNVIDDAGYRESVIAGFNQSMNPIYALAMSVNYVDLNALVRLNDRFYSVFRSPRMVETFATKLASLIITTVEWVLNGELAEARIPAHITSMIGMPNDLRLDMEIKTLTKGAIEALLDLRRGGDAKDTLDKLSSMPEIKEGYATPKEAYTLSYLFLSNDKKKFNDYYQKLFPSSNYVNLNMPSGKISSRTAEVLVQAFKEDAIFKNLTPEDFDTIQQQLTGIDIEQLKVIMLQENTLKVDIPEDIKVDEGRIEYLCKLFLAQYPRFSKEYGLILL